MLLKNAFYLISMDHSLKVIFVFNTNQDVDGLYYCIPLRAIWHSNIASFLKLTYFVGTNFNFSVLLLLYMSTTYEIYLQVTFGLLAGFLWITCEFSADDF